MRVSASLVAATVVLAGSAGIVAATEVPEMVQTSVGQLIMVKFPGNPRAGYKWRLNRQQSEGLALVSVDEVGWIMAPEGSSIYFDKPSVLNVAIKGMVAGEAALAFDYYRTWGSRNRVRTSIVKVIVIPAEEAAK